VRRLVPLLALAALAVAAPAHAAARCEAPKAGARYTARVTAALRAGRDVWGEQLLRAPNGPTVAAAGRFLAPLWWAKGPHGSKLTATGAYYLPFAQPSAARGAESVALHVADGSQILAQRAGGASLGIFVGAAGTERYGSCLGRLGSPALAGGWLPILETRYVDGAGVRYRQESFAARVGSGGSLVSLIRIDVDARRARHAAVVHLVATRRGLVGAGGELRGTTLRRIVPRGRTATIYAGWTATAAPAGALQLDASGYAAARAGIVAYWRQQLAAGGSISVPDARVTAAQRALVVQDLELTWRYSVGNPYEEFSFPESVDVAQVLAEEGQTAAAESVLRTSFTRRSTPYPNWKRGERLVAVAEVYRLSGDEVFVAASTPVLRGYVSTLGAQIERGGLLGRERYSSDIPDSVYGVHSQAVVWEGLSAMADVWAQTGQPALARRARALATRLGTALRRAVLRSQRRLPDGSIFLPVALLGGERPYDSLMEARLGSYWNLVMPYALASGALPAATASGVLRYMLAHGSRLLGLVRAGGYALYGEPAFPASGTDQVYGLNAARFLADEDKPDLLDLSLAGDLAAGMTRGTYVSGEAASVAPLDGSGLRAMYLPPNAASNAAFLETLRLALVHETRGADGRPEGLELAFATPRTWLAPGRRIAVSDLPTSFGPVSYTVAASAGRVTATVDEPSRSHPRTIALRLRLPAGSRLGAVVVDGRRAAVDRATATIRLPVIGGRVELSALVSRRGSK
jgi:hypothetical protein